MQDFCNDIIEQIKASPNERDLIQVINNSMWSLRKERNSFNEAAYVMNMIVSLRASLAESSSMPANNNTRLAIAIFSQFQQERHMF
jgi:hypothetical protein